MTRKDFKLIAATIKSLPLTVPHTAVVAVTNAFAEALVTTNPRFDKERFIEACK
jgi:hypothetical protein